MTIDDGYAGVGPLTAYPSRVTLIREAVARHIPHVRRDTGRECCLHCQERWPCEAISLVRALDASHQEMRDAREDAVEAQLEAMEHSGGEDYALRQLAPFLALSQEARALGYPRGGMCGICADRCVPCRKDFLLNDLATLRGEGSVTSDEYVARLATLTDDYVFALRGGQRSEAAAGPGTDPEQCAEPPAAPLLPSRTVYVVTRVRQLGCTQGHFAHPICGVFSEQDNAERYVRDMGDAHPSYLPRPVFTIHAWRLDEVPARTTTT